MKKYNRGRPEYWEESLRPEETCCHTDSCKKKYQITMVWKTHNEFDTNNNNEKINKYLELTRVREKLWKIRMENIHTIALRRWPWCNGYRRMKWSLRHEFKSWTRLIAFHIALIPLGKVWIRLFSLQLWVNSRTD